MAASRCGRAWLWRWRRNPLRRRSDLVEAWVVLIAWVFAVVGGLLAGQAAASAVERTAEEQRAERREVPAVLVEDAERLPARLSSDHRVWATVRWTAPDGSTRTDETRVPAGTPAGSPVTVWTDPGGRITAQPLSEGEARVHAVAGGVLGACGAAGVVLGAAWVVRLGLERHRMAQWAAEWERIDTREDGKTG